MRLLQRIHNALKHPPHARLFVRKWLSEAACRLSDRAMAPGMVKLCVNSRCNASCLMCDIGNRQKDSIFYDLARTPDAELSVEDCVRLAEEMRAFRPVVVISGVEPLLHSRIDDVVVAFGRERLPVSLSTNGIALPGKAAALVEKGLGQLIVSIDGPQPVHDAIRGCSAFAPATEGLARALEHRRAQGARKMRIAANFCISPHNYMCLEETARLLIEKIGVDAVFFTHMLWVSESASRLHNSLHADLGPASPAQISRTNPAEVRPETLWEQIRAVRSRYGWDRARFNYDFHSADALRVYYQRPQERVGKDRCLIPWLQTTIRADGEVLIHNRCFGYSAGNIRRSGLMEIWNGPCYRKFRRALRRNGLFPVCNRCCGPLA